MQCCSYKNGLIVEIRKSNSQQDITYITIAKDPKNIYTQTTLICNKETIILDSNYDPISIDQLAKGDFIFAYHSNVMTMSIPPQTQAYIIELK